MASSVNLDPFDMWRQAVSKLEEGMNSLGNQSLNSEEFTKALHQLSTVSMQMQLVLEKVLGEYLKAVNLPSRKDIVELAEALRRIEDKLDRIVPVERPALAPRPARTRRPASAPAPEASVAPAAVAAAAPPAQTRRARRARKGA